MNSDYNIAILAVIKMIVDNNSGCVARKLRESGYSSKNYIPSSELETALYQLYMANRNEFFYLLRKCDWNYGNNNWTNSEIRNKIIALVEKHTGIKVDKNNWWVVTINYLYNTKP